MGALRVEDAYPRYSYEDYLNWEDRWELIDGIAYAMAPMPMIKHQRIANNIGWELKNLFQNCKKCQVLAPVDWKISDDTVVQPDNLVICHNPKNQAFISKAPVIIFEVLSKSTFKKDLTVKFELYQKEGVKYYITVDPEEEMAKVYELKDGRYIKMLDTYDEKVEFSFDECEDMNKFDFSRIWE